MSRVLLLQGPAGPFFRKLQDFLEAENFDVWRVCFNAGDMLFSSNKNRIAFWGNKAEWRDFFANLLVPGDVDCIILFGSERPAHKIARDVAAAIGVRVIALEEGYLRPGNITIEDGGNNASSPIAGQLPPYENLFPQDKRKYVPEIRGQRSMVSHGTIYYAIRTIFSYGKQRELFHRHISPLPEIFYWARNAYRKLSAQRSEFPKIQNLLEHWDGKYFLVPLQVAADGNLRQAALGWNSHRLISSALRSFSRSAPDDARLVFKIHPMERGHSNLAPLGFLAWRIVSM
jgi:capsular polysaccharide export protein